MWKVRPPGPRGRVAAALDGAREAVVAALDRPLERVAPGHYVCRVSPARRVAGAVDALALSALVAGAAGVGVGEAEGGREGGELPQNHVNLRAGSPCLPNIPIRDPA